MEKSCGWKGYLVMVHMTVFFLHRWWGMGVICLWPLSELKNSVIGKVLSSIFAAILSHHIILYRFLSYECHNQNGWGWKGALDVILSNLPAQAKPPTASCTGLCLDDFGVSPRKQTTQPGQTHICKWNMNNTSTHTNSLPQEISGTASNLNMWDIPFYHDAWTPI